MKVSNMQRLSRRAAGAPNKIIRGKALTPVFPVDGVVDADIARYVCWPFANNKIGLL